MRAQFHKYSFITVGFLERQRATRANACSSPAAGECLTQVVPLGLCMVMDVFLGETAKEDAVEARVQAVQVDAADMADTGLCLKFREGVMSSMNATGVQGETWSPSQRITI